MTTDIRVFYDISSVAFWNFFLQGHNELLAYLLAEGADPNLCSDTGRSPLFRCVFGVMVDVLWWRTLYILSFFI